MPVTNEKEKLTSAATRFQKSLLGKDIYPVEVTEAMVARAMSRINQHCFPVDGVRIGKSVVLRYDFNDDVGKPKLMNLNKIIVRLSA